MESEATQAVENGEFLVNILTSQKIFLNISEKSWTLPRKQLGEKQLGFHQRFHPWNMFPNVSKGGAGRGSMAESIEGPQR